MSIIKGNKGDTVLFIYLSFSHSLSNYSFRTVLKSVNVRPVFKMDPKTNKDNYRSISIFSNKCKVYGSFMYDQLYPYFNKKFLYCSMVFLQPFSYGPIYLITMVEKWREALDVGDHKGALQTDISKVFS